MITGGGGGRGVSFFCLLGWTTYISIEMMMTTDNTASATGVFNHEDRPAHNNREKRTDCSFQLLPPRLLHLGLELADCDQSSTQNLLRKHAFGQRVTKQ